MLSAVIISSSIMKKEIHFSGSRIFYDVHGKGEPLVLIHGFGEDRSIWNNQLELGKQFQLIIPDLPGSGESDFIESIDPAIGIETYAEVIMSILENEKIACCTMIGHSMGGYITLAFAQKYPELLSKLGLVHSSAFADNEEKINTRLKAIEFVKANGAYAFLKTSIPALYSDPFKAVHPGKVQELVNQSGNFKSETIIQYYQAMISRPGRTEVLTSFPRPIFFIIGEKDTAIPLAQSLHQCHLPAISHIHILSQVGHMGMIEEPLVCNEYITRFIKSG